MIQVRYRKCTFQFLVFLACLVNSVQGYSCSSDADCQYPGWNDFSCSGAESYSDCNNRVWGAFCFSEHCHSASHGRPHYTWHGFKCNDPVVPVCGPGTYSATGTNCLDCPVGSHSQSGGSLVTDLTECTVRMSGPNGGQCEPCPVGTFSFNATNFTTSCTPCASGWTTAEKGSTIVEVTRAVGFNNCCGYTSCRSTARVTTLLQVLSTSTRQSRSRRQSKYLWRSRRSATNGARTTLLVIAPTTGVHPDILIATSHTHGASLFMDTKTTKCPSSLVVWVSFWILVAMRPRYASTITSVVIPIFVGNDSAYQYLSTLQNTYTRTHTYICE